ncbi:hemolysin [Paracoccus tegillarcae]|uniref:Hemolysin n=2 Tax=Paracoccus tegillarcae TaxID=1529068 RepID=A0A2K9EPI1_9RHOB|nr:hemolysin [Paracoccus tegillarcae]
MPPPLSGGEAGEVAGVTTYPIVSVVFPTGQSNYVTQYTHVYTDRYDVAGFVPCFTAGTLIRTDAGDRAAETLQPGDRIWTRDHGFQPIKWCGIRRITASDLVAHEAWRPIRISAGALGKGMPDRDLIVSPQHRVLVRSAIAIRMFGCAEILVAAKRLTELPGIEIDDSCEAVSYVHLMFADHEIVLSNGAETESLYLGKMAVAALGQQAVDEILALFPALENDDAPPSARLIPAGRRVDRLVDRHIRNDHPLVS